MKGLLTLAAASLAAAGPTIAAAQSAIVAKAGETVFDLDGGTVGTVVAIEDDAAIVDTGTAKVMLGLSSFRRREGKLTLPMTRDALESAAAKVESEADRTMAALLAPGTQFFDTQGAMVGTIVAVEGKQVRVQAGTLTAGVPLSVFVKGAGGPAIRSTAAEFMAALEAQRPQPATKRTETTP